MGVYLIGEGPTASGQRYSLQMSSASPGRGCPDKDDDPPLRTVLSVFSNVAWILMTLLPARPSRPNATVMPRARKNVCARRRRPARARGFLGQPMLLLPWLP